MTASGRLTFAEFGQAFMDWVVTPSVVAASIDAAVPQLINDETIDLGGVIKTMTHGMIGKSIVKHYAEHVFSATLPIDLKIVVHFPVGTERYQIYAEVTLWLQAQTWKPLTIYVAIQPVTPENVSLIVDDQSWFSLAKSVGELQTKVKEIIAKKVNETIEAASSIMTFEVLPMVKNAFSADRRPFPQEELPLALVGALPAPPDLPEITALRQSRGPTERSSPGQDTIPREE